MSEPKGWRGDGDVTSLARFEALADLGARQREITAVTLADLDLSSGTVRFPVSEPSSARCR